MNAPGREHEPTEPGSPAHPGIQRRDVLGLVLLLLLGASLRLPFLVEALATSVDGDTAIIGLMALHPPWGGSMWGQPYGSPLDSWVAAPFVAALGPTRLALRLPYFLLSLTLIPLAFFLARCLHPGAGLPAAGLLSCPPAYFLLLSALPPPLYPTTLFLLGLHLLLSVRAGAALEDRRAALGSLVAWGCIGGLALWTHLMAAAVVAAGGSYLLLKARARPWPLLVALVSLLAASAPFWLHAAKEPLSTEVLAVSRRGEPFTDHALRVLSHIHRPIAGLLGAHAPLAEEGAPWVFSPPAAQASLLLLYALGLVGAVRLRSRGAAVLLYAVLGLTLVVFPLPVRSNPNAIRFLTPAYLPLVALAAAGASARLRGRWVWGLVLAACGLHLVAARGLLVEWRRAADSSILVPDCVASRQALEAWGVRRAYASYNTAYCLTYESGERIVASQPWNERFYGYPLPYLDEVRFATTVAWVLMPGMDFGLPSPALFEQQLRSAGGRWSRTRIGPAVIYHRFAPPFGPKVSLLPGGTLAGDGDMATSLLNPAHGPTTFRLPEPRRLGAVTLLAGTEGRWLPRSVEVAAASDDGRFERVWRRRRGRELVKLGWVNGHPQYLIDDDVIAVPLGDRIVSALQITPLGEAEPWSSGEVLLHAPNAAGPWAEELDPGLSWAERRRRLTAEPRRGEASWYYRLLLASRHP